MANKQKDRKIALLLEDLLILEAYIHDLFNFSPLPICFVSPIGVVLEANPAFEKTFNLKTDEVVGEPIENFFEEKEIRRLTKDTFKKGFIAGRQMLFSPKKKKRVSVQVFTKTRKDESNHIVGYFLGLFDITKIKKTEEKLEEARATLEIKVKARTKALEEERASLEVKVEQRTKELQEKIEDLEKFHKLSVGRELRMIELKEEIKKLKKS